MSIATIGATDVLRTAARRFYIHDPENLVGPYDVAAMERAMNNEPVPLNPAEQYETARRLHAYLERGAYIKGGDVEIARRVGVTSRSIERWKRDGWPERTPRPNGTLRPIGWTHELTLEEKWHARTQPTDDGHLLWTGSTTGSSAGVPSLCHRGHTIQAARIAYRIHTGHDPEGSARPACGIDLCVKPDHIEDRPFPNSTCLRGRRP